MEMCVETRTGMIVLLLLVTLVTGNTVYYMDDSTDCSHFSDQVVKSGDEVTVYAKRTGTSTSRQADCTLIFRAEQSGGKLSVDFLSFVINDCNIELELSGGAEGKKYSCGDSVDSYYTLDRRLYINLYKPSVDLQGYNFVLSIKHIDQDLYPPPDDSNPAAVGLIIGVAGGVFGLIFIIGCVGICCFRKYRGGTFLNKPIIPRGEKPRMDSGSNSVSVGYTNESMSGSPMAKKKLLSRSDSDESTGLRPPRTSNLRVPSRLNMPPKPPPAPPVPPPPLYTSGNSTQGNSSQGNSSDSSARNERAIDVDTKRKAEPRANMLGALRNNPRFRNSFKENEKDAEERAKRISSSSSFEKLGNAPSPPSSDGGGPRPPLPTVHKSPKNKKSRLAGISRNPRPTSLSSDEIAQIENGLPEDGHDPNIKVLQDSSSSTTSEVVKINTGETNKKKPNTTHSLRPDRKKTGKNKKMPVEPSAIDASPKASPRAARGRIQSADSQLDDQPRRGRDQDRLFNEPFEKMGSGRYSKGKGRKSPRPGKSTGRGFSHRRGRSMDYLDSRPTTPTSAYGSMEDLESLPPLVRASSKNSLYASRSSLYDRRRRRKGSYPESVVSYRDDMSIGHHGYESYSDSDEFDGYEKPVSRRDKGRMYKSDNDLGKRVREIATQTLRETATQTGQDSYVMSESKVIVKKKRRPRSVSTSGTQTVKKKSKSTDRLNESDKDTVSEKKKRTKTKRSKSSSAIDALDTTDSDKSEKPKPRPKPKPRKSTSADTHLEDLPTTGKPQEQAVVMDPSLLTYYPASEGFAPTQPYLQQQGLPQGYVMKPGQGYQGQPGLPMQQYPNGPAGYPGYPPSQPLPPHMTNQAPPQMTNQAPRQTAPKQCNKSNWDTLCEMTDGHKYKDDISEAGSIASSVFTNNAVGYPDYVNPPMNPYLNHQNNYHPPVPPPAYPIATSVPDYENTEFQTNQSQNRPRKQSSWEMLKGLTETSQPPPQAVNGQARKDRTESIV